MSRAFKDGIVDTIGDLGGTISDPEKLSGADLEQARLIALNGDSVSTNSVGTKTLGTNAAFTGSPNSAALSGADLERYTGVQ